MAWLLQIGSGELRSFTDLQCTNLKRALRSQAAGTFTFRLNLQGMESDPIANPDDLATVLWVEGDTATTMFSGRVTKIPLAGSTKEEEQTYEISDGWSDFERITFQQQWNRITGVDESGTPTTAYQYSACCLLGVDILGNAQDSGAVIAEAVTWAIARGANCQMGEILKDGETSVGTPVPVDEVTDLPVAEIIKKMLRFTPDAVAWFDYSTTPPKFNVTRRAQCAPVTLPFTEQGDRVEITPRKDLQRSEVLIRFEQDNQTDGVPSVTVTADGAPDGTDGLAFDALVSTVRLAGSNAAFQKQYVQAQAIPTDNSSGENGGPVDDPTVNWWWKHVPWLQKFSKDRLSLTNVYGSVDPGQMDPNGDGDAIEDDITKYPNELISGTVAPWMNCYVGHTTWTALVYYNYPDTSDAESDAAEEVFGPSDGTDNASGQVPVYAQVVGTSAVTQTYAQLSSYTGGEPVPAGLAAQLYAALNPLQYEGTWDVIRQEPSAGGALGVLLNLSGGRAEWATMNALVQEIEDDLDNGTTTYKFGPAGHLTIQDLMEQLRATRRRTTSMRIKERSTGQPSDAPTVEGPSHGPDASNSTPPTAFRYPWIDYISAQEGLDGSATYQALQGYGQSSFAGTDGIDHSGPLENLEVSVGNDGSGWTGPYYDGASLYNAFSLVSGDDTPANDWLWLGRTDSGGNGGSVRIVPFDPSIYLSQNLDPGADGAGDAFINLSLSDMELNLQDSAASYLKASISDGHSPEIDLYNSSSESSNIIDENSVTITGGSGGGASDDATLTMTGHDGASVTIDTSDIGGDAAVMQQIEWYGSGGVLNKAYALCTDPDVSAGTSDFVAAVKAVISSMTMHGTCNSDGTFTITLS
jgi:hypothetical protein